MRRNVIQGVAKLPGRKVRFGGRSILLRADEHGAELHIRNKARL